MLRTPIEAHNSNQTPIEAHNLNQTPIQVNNSNQTPIQVNNSNQLPIEAHKSKQLHHEAPKLRKTPLEAYNLEKDVQRRPLGRKTTISNNPLWLINYNEFYKGRIGLQEVEAPYFTLFSALTNAFSVSSYVFIILDSYTMALIKSVGDIFIFDSHARNCFGMPDPNGSAVVMKCADIKSLEQYLHQLSFELGCETFEIVPVEFYPVKNDSPTKTKRCNETDILKCARLQKAREYKK